MTYQTRLKVTSLIIAVITTLGTIGIFKEMENLAISVVAALMSSLGLYVWGETKRPTNNKHSNNYDL